jgi:glycosyltransferase involved in cell wall biosynthesis
MRLVVITNILAPYRIPLFEALRSRVDDFTVLLMAKTEENRQWTIDHVNFKTESLPGLHCLLGGAETSIHINYGIIRRLIRLKPDVVLSGGFSLANIAAYIYCKLFGAAYVGWGELTLKDGAERSGVKRAIRRIMTHGSTGSIASSTATKEAFLHYGARQDTVLTTILPFDVASLHAAAMTFRVSDNGKRLRAQFPGPIVLSIGQLIQRKGYQELLAIYQSILKTNPTIQLVIIGEGPERTALEAQVKDTELANVHFVGHVQPADLHKYLGISDVFIFPTRYDCFGLVLSEAMAAQLVVVSSVHAMATQDLVVHGKTGFVIDPSDTHASAAVLLNALTLSADDRDRIGSAAYERVRQCDPQLAAQSMIEFFQKLSRTMS